MALLGRHSKLIEVAGGGGIETVVDGVQQLTFYDLNIVAYPLANFTGTVEFYIGSFLAGTVTYIAESKLAVFVPSPPQYPEIFPATAKKTIHEFESGVTGSEIKASVKVTNTGVPMMSFKVHFMRKYSGI